MISNSQSIKEFSERNNKLVEERYHVKPIAAVSVTTAGDSLVGARDQWSSDNQNTIDLAAR